MSETKFTRGAWVINNRPPYMIGVEGADDFICDGMNIYDAHLIAAAPEMYAMLDEYDKSDCVDAAFFSRVKRVLAKARGEITTNGEQNTNKGQSEIKSPDTVNGGAV